MALPGISHRLIVPCATPAIRKQACNGTKNTARRNAVWPVPSGRKFLFRLDHRPTRTDSIFIKGLDLKIVGTVFVHRLEIIFVGPKHLHRRV